MSIYSALKLTSWRLKKERIKLTKRFTAIVTALALILALTVTAFAATTETFYGGYSDWFSKGSIVVELTNVSSRKDVVLSEKEAEEYFDTANELEMAVYFDYDEGELITIKDILNYYNYYKGGVPIYYADSAPVTVTAKTAMRTFFFSYKGNTVKYNYEPKYYSYDEYVEDFENKKVYTERPDYWLIADSTTATLYEPGKYLFVIADDGLVSSSPAGMFCVHIADTAKEISVAPTTSRILVNGKAVEFEAYNINGYNYFKLRDLAMAVNNTEKNFEVAWDAEKNAINLISNKPYTPAGTELAKGDGKAKIAVPTTSKIYKDGEEISLVSYNINGYNYFKLRDITRLFDIGVSWDGVANTIVIDTSASYVE